MGEIICGQAGNLEVGDLVKVSTILRAQRDVVCEVEIHSTAVHEHCFCLVVISVVPDPNEAVVQAVGRTKEESANSRQAVRTHPAGGRRSDDRFTGELVHIGLNVSLAKERIEIFLCIAGVTVVALHGKPRV